MDIYSTSITASSMIRADDGTYYGTVLASKHGLGSDVFVARAVHRKDDLQVENVLCSYEVTTAGDVNIYVDEPTSIRVTIAKSTPSASNGIMGEGGEYADA